MIEVDGNGAKRGRERRSEQTFVETWRGNG
jgi:hypothetical protein